MWRPPGSSSSTSSWPTDLAWYCDLDDGTPTGENDPSSFVRWVCPALRRPDPQSDARD